MSRNCGKKCVHAFMRENVLQKQKWKKNRFIFQLNNWKKQFRIHFRWVLTICYSKIVSLSKTDEVRIWNNVNWIVSDAIPFVYVRSSLYKQHSIFVSSSFVHWEREREINNEWSKTGIRIDWNDLCCTVWSFQLIYRRWPANSFIAGCLKIVTRLLCSLNSVQFTKIKVRN